MQTIERAFAVATAPRRVTTLALVSFGAFALLLAGVGIHGVVAHAVIDQTREIGVRMALGAGTGDVRRMVVRQAMFPVALGALAGLAGVLALGRLLGGLLFEVRGSDPLTIVVVTSVLAAVALAASWLPARRASALDPLIAMRRD